MNARSRINAGFIYAGLPCQVLIKHLGIQSRKYGMLYRSGKWVEVTPILHKLIEMFVHF